VRLPPAFAAAAALLAALTACGGSDDGACGPLRREALDPNFLQHALSDEGVEYASDPPTSGPHQPTPPVSGVLDEPLTRPVQVGVLERGDVLVQFRPGLPADQLSDLEGLAGEGVVIAPNDELDDPVVATAWVHKQVCSSVDVEELERFVAERRGKGPAH
jgi:hypothetical protein